MLSGSRDCQDALAQDDSTVLQDTDDPNGLSVQHEEATGTVLRSWPSIEAFRDPQSDNDGHSTSWGVTLHLADADAVAARRNAETRIENIVIKG